MTDLFDPDSILADPWTCGGCKSGAHDQCAGCDCEDSWHYEAPEDATEPDLGSCPYYARYRQFPGHDPNGICGGGCVDEPRCVTMEPDNGWPSAADREGVRP